jgi:hypothetical protein
MRTVVAVFGLLLGGAFVAAQEPLPAEQAQKIAAVLAEHAGKLTDAQVKTDVDAKKPYGVTKGELGAVVIPDKALTAEVLTKAGKDVVPLGQLWMRGLTPVVSGNATAADKLRIVEVKHKDDKHDLPLLLLGARSAKGKLELVVYAKDKEPLLVLPLETADHNQEQPIEFTGKGEGESGTITLHVLGKYQAELPVAKLTP